MEKMFLHFWNEPDEVTAFFFFLTVVKGVAIDFMKKKIRYVKGFHKKTKKKGGG